MSSDYETGSDSEPEEELVDPQIGSDNESEINEEEKKDKSVKSSLFSLPKCSLEGIQNQPTAKERLAKAEFQLQQKYTGNRSNNTGVTRRNALNFDTNYKINTSLEQIKDETREEHIIQPHILNLNMPDLKLSKCTIFQFIFITIFLKFL